MKQKTFLGIALTLLLFSTMTFAEVITTETNNGNLVMQDFPEIPDSLVASLNRYQNVRSAGFLDWTEDGNGIFVSTRFGDVSQVHRVTHAGGSEFSQILLLDPGSDDDAIMLTDGESRNGSVVWDRSGRCRQPKLQLSRGL